MSIVIFRYLFSTLKDDDSLDSVNPKRIILDDKLIVSIKSIHFYLLRVGRKSYLILSEIRTAFRSFLHYFCPINCDLEIPLQCLIC